MSHPIIAEHTGKDREANTIDVRNSCFDFIDGVDVESGDPEEIFFPEPEVKPSLTFLILKPDSSEASLSRYGISHVTWPNGSHVVDVPEPHEETLEPPRLRRWPSEDGMGECEHQSLSSIPLQRSSLALLKAEDAFATVEGYGFTKTGAVFSSSEASTLALLEELVSTLPQFYRLSRSCPRGDSLRMPCCLSARFESLVKPSFNPYLYMNGSDPDAWTDLHVPRASTIFRDELRLFGMRLRECHSRRHRLSEPTFPYVVHREKLLTFQLLHANDFFHFVSKSLPRLMRLLTLAEHQLSDPKVWVLLSSVHQDFAYEILEALGLRARLINYDPCTIYRADTLYFAVNGEGQTLPTIDEVRAVRRLLRSPRHLTSAQLRSAISRPLPERYVILLDRSDAAPRMKADGVTVSIPRQLANLSQVREAIEPPLAHRGLTLKVVQAASLSLKEQTSWFTHADALIGVHGAGLTNLLLLPKHAAVLELIPGAELIPNEIETTSPLSSTCGFTMFWYLAAVRRLPYFALVLHEFGWEDSISVPSEAIVPSVIQMVEAVGKSDVPPPPPEEQRPSAHDEL